MKLLCDLFQPIILKYHPIQTMVGLKIVLLWTFPRFFKMELQSHKAMLQQFFKLFYESDKIVHVMICVCSVQVLFTIGIHAEIKLLITYINFMTHSKMPKVMLNTVSRFYLPNYAKEKWNLGLVGGRKCENNLKADSALGARCRVDKIMCIERRGRREKKRWSSFSSIQYCLNSIQEIQGRKRNECNHLDVKTNLHALTHLYTDYVFTAHGRQWTSWFDLFTIPSRDFKLK